MTASQTPATNPQAATHPYATTPRQLWTKTRGILTPQGSPLATPQPNAPTARGPHTATEHTYARLTPLNQPLPQTSSPLSNIPQGPPLTAPKAHPASATNLQAPTQPFDGRPITLNNTSQGALR